MTNQDDSPLELKLFHFRCPLCGAHPSEIPLSQIVETWAGTSESRLELLCEHLVRSVRQIQSRWANPRFLQEREALPQHFEKAFGSPPGTALPELRETPGKELAFEVPCPLCDSPPGPRTSDNYFSAWESACKVQLGNALFETSLVMWAVLRSLPQWASGPRLDSVNLLRQALVNLAWAADLMACPQCGRPVTCLFGQGEKSFCRHCLDMGGGGPHLQAGLQIDLTTGVVEFIDSKGKPEAPAKNSMKHLPPDRGQPKRSGSRKSKASD